VLLLLDYDTIPNVFFVEISSQEQAWYNVEEAIVPQQ
jgi:hypothetical protein